MEKLINDFYLDDEEYCWIENQSRPNWIISEDFKKRYKRDQFQNFYVKCKDCGKMVNLKKISRSLLEKEYLCKNCRGKGERNGMYGKHHSEEVRKILSEKNSGENNYWKGKHLPDSIKKKLSDAQKGKFAGEKNPMYGVNVYKLVEERYGKERVEEMKKKISASVTGEKNPFYGKHHTDETKNKISEAVHSEKFIKIVGSDENRKKISEALAKSSKFKELKEYRKSEEYRKLQSERLKKSEKHKQSLNDPAFIKKRRLLTRKQILELKDKSGIERSFMPMFNPKACEIFDKIMEENKTHIQHAMNGGEYSIPKLGYFVDGYDAENNIVYEFDEKYHYLPNGELRDCDKKRQKEIEDFLKCKFIRIKEDEINKYRDD